MQDALLLDSFDFVAQDSMESWIAAALARGQALRTHDHSLYPSTDDPRLLATAKSLHQAWREWADEADSLLRRSKAYKTIRGVEPLAYLVARTRAMLKMTPEIALARLEQVRRGEVITIEEARRAIRSSARR